VKKVTARKIDLILLRVGCLRGVRRVGGEFVSVCHKELESNIIEVTRFF
jgi:hypothetical protein